MNYVLSGMRERNTLIFENVVTVISLISYPGSLFNFEALGRSFYFWSLKEGGTYFKARGTNHMKFQDFEIFYFQFTVNIANTSYFYLSIASCLLYLHFNLVSVKSWSDF